MLEFYEAYSDVDDMMSLTEDLFHRLQTRIREGKPLVYGEHAIDLTPPYRRLRMLDAVGQGLKERGVAVEEQDLRSKDRLLDAGRSLKLDLDRDAPWGKLLTKLFEEVAEPKLIQPTFIVDYPLEVSPLSKKKKDDPALVDRFELFIAGLECANGFSELNDPDDQRARFEGQQKERARGDAEAHVMDLDYVRALAHGLPPTGGEGIGIDRLAMLFTDSPSIRDVILFPHLRPEDAPGPEGE
jgi:lysyl-tRNA synthetase class 2